MVTIYGKDVEQILLVTYTKNGKFEKIVDPQIFKNIVVNKKINGGSDNNQKCKENTMDPQSGREIKDTEIAALTGNWSKDGNARADDDYIFNGCTTFYNLQNLSVSNLQNKGFREFNTDKFNADNWVYIDVAGSYTGYYRVYYKTPEDVYGARSTKPNCTEFYATSNGLSQACLNQIWKDAGCTTPGKYNKDNAWVKSKTISQISSDANAWATMTDEEHRVGCYGNTGECKLYKNTDTNLSQACMDQIWREAGCSGSQWIYTDDWPKSKTINQLQLDAKIWASKDTAEHRLKCNNYTVAERGTGECSAYNKDSKGLSQQCLNQLWKNAGCKGNGLSGDYYNNLDMSSVISDYNTWANRENEDRKRTCGNYTVAEISNNEAKSLAGSGNACNSYNMDSTNLSQACLNQISTNNPNCNYTYNANNNNKTIKQLIDERNEYAKGTTFADRKKCGTNLTATDKEFITKVGTDSNCDIYTLNSTNVSNECIDQIWKNTGCTKFPSRYKDNSGSISQISDWSQTVKDNDRRSRQWAEQCGNYNMNEWGKGKCSEYHNTHTNISQECLDELWGNAGCTKTNPYNASHQYVKDKTLQQHIDTINDKSNRASEEKKAQCGNYTNKEKLDICNDINKIFTTECTNLSNLNNSNRDIILNNKKELCKANTTNLNTDNCTKFMNDNITNYNNYITSQCENELNMLTDNICKYTYANNSTDPVIANSIKYKQINGCIVDNKFKNTPECITIANNNKSYFINPSAEYCRDNMDQQYCTDFYKDTVADMKKACNSNFINKKENFDNNCCYTNTQLTQECLDSGDIPQPQQNMIKDHLGYYNKYCNDKERIKEPVCQEYINDPYYNNFTKELKELDNPYVPPPEEDIFMKYSWVLLVFLIIIFSFLITNKFSSSNYKQIYKNIN